MADATQSQKLTSRDPVSLGRYEIQERIGSGAAGSVYRAWDPLLARDVAVKVVHTHLSDELRAEYLERYLVEARVVGQMNHPSIVQVYDAGSDEERPFLVMELCAGPTLQGLLSVASPLSPEEAHWVALQLLQGLNHVHKQGVVHRDLKTSNVLIHGHSLKLADFGVARTAGGNNTIDGTLIGTPLYMSPEQVRGEIADNRADLWSLGIMLYECVTGVRPFDGAPLAVLHKVSSDDFPPLDEVAPAIATRYEGFFERALAKAKDKRFQSAREMFDALIAIVPLAELKVPTALTELGFAPLDGQAAALSLGQFSWGSTQGGFPPSQLTSTPHSLGSGAEVTADGGPQFTLSPQAEGDPLPPVPPQPSSRSRPKWATPVAATSLIVFSLGTLVWMTLSGQSSAPPPLSQAVASLPKAPQDTKPQGEQIAQHQANPPSADAPPRGAAEAPSKSLAPTASAAKVDPLPPAQAPPSNRAPGEAPPHQTKALAAVARAPAPVAKPLPKADPAPPEEAPPLASAPKLAITDNSASEPAPKLAPQPAPASAQAPASKPAPEAVASLPPTPSVSHTPPEGLVAGEPTTFSASVPDMPKGAALLLRWEQGGKTGKVSMDPQRRGRQVASITPAEGALSYHFEVLLPGGEAMPIKGRYTLTPEPPKTMLPPMGF